LLGHGVVNCSCSTVIVASFLKATNNAAEGTEIPLSAVAFPLASVSLIELMAWQNVVSTA
jgi:hypothetical protein